MIYAALALAGAVPVLAESPAQRDAGGQYDNMRVDTVERYFGTFDSDGTGGPIYRLPSVCKILDNLIDRELQMALMAADLWQFRREREVYREQDGKVRVSPCTPYQLSI